MATQLQESMKNPPDHGPAGFFVYGVQQNRVITWSSSSQA